jgi:hypothetical protein
MSDTEWTRVRWRNAPLPQEPLTDATRAALHIPATLRPIGNRDVTQLSVFDPALKHYNAAYRAADPRFADAEVSRQWHAARRTAIDVILGAISASSYADSLVLRGSILLRAWFGQAAREPGDLDFVVVPVEWQLDEWRTGEMLDAIAQAAETASAGSGIRIIAKGAVSDDIWTYERVPGRRLVLPWETAGPAGGLPGGWIQLDFVFNEHLPVAPEPTLIPAAAPERPDAVLSAATAELSLAWKIMWLLTDTYPQGKDLYDAVLLAEHTYLRYEVLRDAFAHSDESQLSAKLTIDRIGGLFTEWGHFKAEYPKQPSTDTEYVQRLATALAPTFDSDRP